MTSSHTSSRNVQNVLLAVLLPLPSICFTFYLSRLPSSILDDVQGFGQDQETFWNARRCGALCKWGIRHPLGLLNVLFFLNVNLLFWLISIVQHSTWLIDLYWSILPVMIIHYFSSHPLALYDQLRSRVVTLLVWIWSIRLTHSYFRRENWNWGEREDWRFSDLRKKHGKNWWWISFFLVYVSQQIFLVGICLPFYTIHRSQLSWTFWDALATGICVSGITIAYLADTQLYRFVHENSLLRELGVPTAPVLEKDLWFYSRHPNYFGEQLWWWGLALYSWNVRQGWTVIGTIINSCCLAYVTVLVERKLLLKKTRTDAYKKYQQSTSVWIPWFKVELDKGKAI